jgi:histidyl-tRNA synthetase
MKDNDNIQAKILKGTRDFLPAQMLQRDYVVNTLVEVFQRYGLEPLTTPAIEYMEVLTRKYGEEGEKLIYRLAYKGGDVLALRYDLTIPLCRVYAMHANSLPKPFKRYQIQPVWRADRPQKGRLREFYQCDFDVIGSDDMMVDAEIISITHDCMAALGFDHFTIRINNRKVLNALLEYARIPPSIGPDVLRSVDKLDKLGIKTVTAELQKQGLSETSLNTFIPFLSMKGDPAEVLRELSSILKETPSGAQTLEEMESLFGHLSDFAIPGDRRCWDVSLARGLDYYTGPIYETVVEEPNVGSLSGGGRYDNLVGEFTGEETPATGASIGLERIITVMDEQKMFPETATVAQVLVVHLGGDYRSHAITIAGALRKAGLKTEVYYHEDRLKKQLTYANKRGIPYVVIAAPDELKEGKVIVRNMATGEQEMVPVESTPANLSHKLSLKN